MASLTDRRKEIQKEIIKESKKAKKERKKLKGYSSKSIPIIDASKKGKRKSIRKNFTKEFRREFDRMTVDEQDSIIKGILEMDRFPTVSRIVKRLKIENKEAKAYDKEFRKYIKKSNISNLNEYDILERDFTNHIECKKDKARKKGLIYTDPLMRSAIRIDEKALAKTLKAITNPSKQIKRSQEVVDHFDKLMFGDGKYKLDFSLLKDKDDMIEKTTKKLIKSLNKTRIESFKL